MYAMQACTCTCTHLHTCLTVQIHAYSRTFPGKLIQANVAARAHYFIDTHMDLSSKPDDKLDGHAMTIRNVFESCVWDSEEAMEACMAEMFKTCTATNMFEVEVRYF
jgi:hypothetical protein